MPNSVRQQIVDRCVSALAIQKGDTYKVTVKLVTTDWKHYESISKSDVPAILVMDGDEEREWACLPGSSTQDAEGSLPITFHGILFSHRDSTEQDLDDLIRDIGLVVLNDSTLKGLCFSIEPVTVLTDRGTVKSFAFLEVTYMFRYFYNSASGG